MYSTLITRSGEHDVGFHSWITICSIAGQVKLGVHALQLLIAATSLLGSSFLLCNSTLHYQSGALTSPFPSASSPSSVASASSMMDHCDVRSPGCDTRYILLDSAVHCSSFISSSPSVASLALPILAVTQCLKKHHE